MKANKMIKQTNKKNKVIYSMPQKTLVVLVSLIFLIGCNTMQTDDISNQITKSNLDKISTINLAEISTTPPLTVEQATEQIIQDANEPNLPLTTVTLSLEQVRQAALANNLNLKSELFNPTISQLSLKQEEADFDSTIYASTGYRHSESTGSDIVSESQDFTIGITKPLPTGAEIQAELPTSNDYSSGGLAQAAASVSYIESLLRGGGSRINTQSIRIAAHQWNITSARTKVTAINLLAGADIAYWRLYSANKELEVRREQYKLAQDQLSNAQKKVAAGSAARIEIVRAEAGLSSRLESVINSETAVERYRRDLLQIINQKDIPLETPITIVMQTEPNPLGLELDEQKLVELALANRMEMFDLEQRLTIDDLRIELAQNQLLPNLLLSYTYTRQAQNNNLPEAFNNLTDDASDNHSVGISASIPLGNRAAQAALQRAKLEKLQDISEKERYQQMISLEVYEAVSDLQGSWRRILAAEQGVTAAYRDYQLEQSQFQLGTRTSTDVLLAAARLADTQLSRIRSFADYEIAQVNLAKATGTLLGQGEFLITSMNSDPAE